MKHATEILDELEKSEGRRNCRFLMIGIAIVATTLVALFLLSVGEIRQVKGTVTGLYGKPDDTGETIYLLVTLENGNSVKVSLPAKAPFIKNARVIASEKTTKLFGLKRYSFIAYEESERPTRE